MDAFVTSIVLIVAVVPEGLPTIVAISLSINIIKLVHDRTRSSKNSSRPKPSAASTSSVPTKPAPSPKTG